MLIKSDTVLTQLPFHSFWVSVKLLRVFRVYHKPDRNIILFNIQANNFLRLFINFTKHFNPDRCKM